MGKVDEVNCMACLGSPDRGRPWDLFSSKDRGVIHALVISPFTDKAYRLCEVGTNDGGTGIFIEKTTTIYDRQGNRLGRRRH